MKEDIRLNEFPKESGVYKIIWHGSVIYIGSSKDLHHRMKKHRQHIKVGYASCYKNGKKGFYLFLQNNPFTVEFELTEKYREREQELIDYYEPIFNEIKAYTGLVSLNREDYQKRYNKQYRETHKDEKKQYDKQYHKRKCNYMGEILTLHALTTRFFRQGIKHPTQEAKKYLVEK